MNTALELGNKTDVLPDRPLLCTDIKLLLNRKSAEIEQILLIEKNFKIACTVISKEGYGFIGKHAISLQKTDKGLNILNINQYSIFFSARVAREDKKLITRILNEINPILREIKLHYQEEAVKQIDREVQFNDAIDQVSDENIIKKVSKKIGKILGGYFAKKLEASNQKRIDFISSIITILQDTIEYYKDEIVLNAQQEIHKKLLEQLNETKYIFEDIKRRIENKLNSEKEINKFYGIK